MTFKIGQIVKENIIDCKSNNGKLICELSEREWVVTDILENGSVIGKHNGLVKFLYVPEPYMTCMNRPIYLKGE